MNLEYEQIGKWLNSYQISKVINTINRSKKVEITDGSPDGKLSHIVIKGTTTPVGYIGADNQIEKVNPKDESLKIYHDFLERIYKIITNADRV